MMDERINKKKKESNLYKKTIKEKIYDIINRLNRKKIIWSKSIF